MLWMFEPRTVEAEKRQSAVGGASSLVLLLLSLMVLYYLPNPTRQTSAFESRHREVKCS
jgi:hypothetical protein